MMLSRLLLPLCLLLCLMGQAQITFIVDAIPSNTPAGDVIHIAGDFQGWDPGSVAHILTEDVNQGWHHITLPASVTSLEFKFTRGDWSSVEGDENGNVIANRSHAISNGDTVYLQILSWEDLGGGSGGGGTGGQSTAASNVQVLTDSFFMPQLNRYRRVWIYLPPDYAETTRNYPVLYMLDGQNVFDASTSFIGEWEVDETLNELHTNGDPGIIVVAVDNGQSLRTAEYTPWVNPTYGGGDGGLYIDFIVEDLIPFINSNYRTLSTREHTGIMGSSLGGLMSTYAGIEHQDVFSKVGAFSPAYWINPEAYDHVSNTGKQDDMRIYQIAGTLEGAQYIDNMFSMENTLITAGFGGDEVRTIEAADGEHSEWFWAREFEAAYKWLFFNNATSAAAPRAQEEAITLYPNPIRSGEQLSLQLQLSQGAEVEIRITDITGLQHMVIHSGLLAAGAHTLKLDAEALNLAAGVYICEVFKHDTRMVKRIIVE